jgi:hypothetical protein
VYPLNHPEGKVKKSGYATPVADPDTPVPPSFRPDAGTEETRSSPGMHRMNRMMGFCFLINESGRDPEYPLNLF